MNSVLKWLKEYIGDDKMLVDYLYITLKLFDKYGKWLYNYINQISLVDEKLWEIIKFFKEEKYNRKDIYTLLESAIKETWYNVYEVKVGEQSETNIVNLENPSDIIEEKVSDIWVYAKSADNKIYKRFVLDDVKKILNLI